jgi:hypothetical protein
MSEIRQFFVAKQPFEIVHTDGTSVKIHRAYTKSNSNGKFSTPYIPADPVVKLIDECESLIQHLLDSGYIENDPTGDRVDEVMDKLRAFRGDILKKE